MTLTLVDLSHNNGGNLDFHAAKAWGLAGVYLKATEGASFVDPTFVARAEAAFAAGLRVGAYHFADTIVEPHIEAAHFLEVASSVGCDLKPMLDYEKTVRSPAASTTWGLGFLDFVQAEWTEPGCYTGHGFTDSHLTPDPRLAAFDLWVAHYTSAATPAPLPKPWTSWVMWQWATIGIPGAPVPPNIPGIGRVDTNRCPDLTPLLISGAAPVPPIPQPLPEEDMPVIINCPDRSAQGLLCGEKLFHLASPADSQAFEKKCGAPVTVTGAQYDEFVKV